MQKASSKQFYRTLWSLVLPITLQGLINQAVNSADVFMLGYVGQDALSAVSLANQVSFWLVGFFWGATSGTSLMIAQYWGKKDLRAVQAVMGIGFRVSFLVTAALTVLAFLFPAQIMTIFTNEPELIRIGTSYLRIISFTFIFQSVTQIYECSMRSIGRAGVSTAISSVALGINVFLNATLIFGWFGLPKLGVLGVAIATVIARAIETVLCVADAVHSRIIHYEPGILLGKHPELQKDFFHYSIPALINDLSWTIAFSTYSIILGHMGTDVVAASTVATTIRDLCTVLAMSLGAAAVTMIGNELGAGQLDDAKRDGFRIVILSIVAGAVTGVVILLLRPFLLWIFPLTDTAKDYLKFMLLISAYYVVGQSVNTAIITGIFRAGGDTKFGMLCDTINMWCIAVPLGFLCAFVLKLPPKVVYFVLCLDEFYKIPAEVIHYRKYAWLKNVTHEVE